MTLVCGHSLFHRGGIGMSKIHDALDLVEDLLIGVIRQIKCGLLPQIKNNFLRYAEALQSVLFATISAHCFM